MVKVNCSKVSKACRKNKLGADSSNASLVFEYFKTKAGGVMKKDTLNAKIIRAVKKIYKSIKNPKQPNTTCIKIDNKLKKPFEIWCRFTKLYTTNQNFIDEICQVDSGPVYSKEPKVKSKSSPKSFNSAYCREFFGTEIMQKSYLLAMELLFIQFDPSSLCKKFNVYCCQNTVHSIDCSAKWLELENYFNYYYLTNNGISNPLREIPTQCMNLDEIDPKF